MTADEYGSSNPETGATSSSSNPSKEERIEQAFQLLRDGKVLQSQGQNWNASEKFTIGHEILCSLSHDQPRGTDEERQIAELYEQKAHEYWNQSRQCLIEAMKDEKEKHQNQDFYNTLTDKEAETRIETFSSLFSKRVVMETILSTRQQQQQHQKAEEHQSLTDKQWSIEERLQDLNKSLPSGFKTTDERMNEINRGLNKLGLSLYTQKEPFARFQEDIVPKSEEEQVEEILAQAKDEVAMNKKFGTSENTTSNVGESNAEQEEDDDDDDDDTDDEEDEEDAFLDDAQLAIKKIRKRAVKAQVKLAELIALLDEAKSAKEAEDADEEIKHDGSESDIEKPDADLYLASSKKKLKSAQKDLRKALAEWIESSL